MPRILLVEDDASIRENTQDILELQGFEVIAAENGRSGLQLALTKLPDLVLCDVMMPEMDGYEFLAALRQHASIKRIPVIFSTAQVTREHQRQGMEMGADDYLSKPFTAEELLNAINTRLNRHEQLADPYLNERQKSKQLRQEVSENQQKLQESQHLEHLKSDLLQNLLQDLRPSLSNINMAILLLKQAKNDAERDRYLTILQEECAREIQLLNEVEHLQKLLTPENAQLLQRFRLLNNQVQQGG